MLRAIGPGSVSSVLKIGLDVFHALLWLLLLLAVLTLLGILVAQPFIVANTSFEGTSINGETNPQRLREMLLSPAIPAVVAAGALYLGGLVFIVGRLRRVFLTLTQGDPFRPENVQRLRRIGFALGGLELLSYAVRWAVMMWDRTDGATQFRQVGEDFNLTIWFAVLVVLVLAEVFREGARLRREAELTI
jgi:hypothetical protein